MQPCVGHVLFFLCNSALYMRLIMSGSTHQPLCLKNSMLRCKKCVSRAFPWGISDLLCVCQWFAQSLEQHFGAENCKAQGWVASVHCQPDRVQLSAGEGHRHFQVPAISQLYGIRKEFVKNHGFLGRIEAC